MEELTDQNLQRLAQNPENKVYQYVDDPEDAKRPRLGADDMRDYVKAIRKEYLRLRRVHPDWNDETIRNVIYKAKAKWNYFGKYYSQFFAMVTMREFETLQGPKAMDVMKHVFQMIFIMKQMEVGMYTKQQADALIQRYFLEHFKTTKSLEQLKAEEDRAKRIRNG